MIDAEDMELAFKAAEFRKDFDALLDKHGCRMQMGWAGKWAYMQLVWQSHHSKALTLAKVCKKGKLRILTEYEEMTR